MCTYLSHDLGEQYALKHRCTYGTRLLYVAAIGFRGSRDGYNCVETTRAASDTNVVFPPSARLADHQEGFGGAAVVSLLTYSKCVECVSNQTKLLC